TPLLEALWLSWTKFTFRPRSENQVSRKVSIKKPRSSPNTFGLNKSTSGMAVTSISIKKPCLPEWLIGIRRNRFYAAVQPMRAIDRQKYIACDKRFLQDRPLSVPDASRLSE